MKKTKYRIIKVACCPPAHQVQRKWLGIWWNIGPERLLAYCESFIHDKLNPVVREYNG
jgi:hypothetical protein